MIDPPEAAADPGIVAVTGATGFIGSHLLSRLDSRGHASRALIRHKPHRFLNVPDSTQVFSGSLRDRDAIAALLTGAQTCIHSAGATTALNVSGYHTANAIGTYNMIAGAAAAEVQHFIHVSSQAARAPWISDYAASKAMSEAVLEPFNAEMKITIIRPPAVIGPGDPMLQPMFDLIRLGWLPAPSEPRGETRRFAVISVRDLVSTLIQAVDAPGTNGAMVEPCSIPSTNWRQIASEVSDIVSRKVRILRSGPTLMKGAGVFADALAQLTRRPLPLSGGKVRELLAVDWTYDHPVRDAMNLKEIFGACLVDH